MYADHGWPAEQVDHVVGEAVAERVAAKGQPGVPNQASALVSIFRVPARAIQEHRFADTERVRTGSGTDLCRSYPRLSKFANFGCLPLLGNSRSQSLALVRGISSRAGRPRSDLCSTLSRGARASRPRTGCPNPTSDSVCRGQRSLTPIAPRPRCRWVPKRAAKHRAGTRCAPVPCRRRQPFPCTASTTALQRWGCRDLHRTARGHRHWRCR